MAELESRKREKLLKEKSHDRNLQFIIKNFTLVGKQKPKQRQEAEQMAKTPKEPKENYELRWFWLRKQKSVN